jgi:hypothetical protein
LKINHILKEDRREDMAFLNNDERKEILEVRQDEM